VESKETQEEEQKGDRKVTFFISQKRTKTNYL
jgi:hypothetical protein